MQNRQDHDELVHLEESTVPHLLIFGYGNPSRGDDALGPLLLERLKEHFDEKPRSIEAIELLTDFQLQIEHVLDLVNRDLVLFVDAHVSCPSPYSFQLLLEKFDASYTSHALSPEAILWVYQQINGQSPPPSFLLSIRGEGFELGDGLSRKAQDNLDAAVAFTLDLFENPNLGYFRQQCTVSGSCS